MEDEETLNGFCSGLPRFSVDSAEDLGAPLALSEVWTALTSMQGGKAPCIDGLPVEFYKIFWADLAAYVLEDFEESIARGSLPQRERKLF